MLFRSEKEIRGRTCREREGERERGRESDMQRGTERDGEEWREVLANRYKPASHTTVHTSLYTVGAESVSVTWVSYYEQPGWWSGAVPSPGVLPGSPGRGWGPTRLASLPILSFTPSGSWPSQPAAPHVETRGPLCGGSGWGICSLLSPESWFCFQTEKPILSPVHQQ